VHFTQPLSWPTGMHSQTPDAFAGIDRLYGAGTVATLQSACVYVVGVGGVGSWVVESLVRSGVGEIRMADLDDLCTSNINRQIHALSDTVGQSKIEVMAARCRAISPSIRLRLDHTFITEKTQADFITADIDCLIDCGDNQMAKAALIAYAKRLKIPVMTVGAAGGRVDPSRIQVRDLAKTDGDALLAAVRQTLKNRFGFSRDTKARFGVQAVYSDEQTRYQQADGAIGQAKPRGAQRLDCAGSLGAVTHVTASFAFAATARALEIILTRKSRASTPANN
jgi:tRNA threonylcarbamoyladenosine dehydratase